MKKLIRLPILFLSTLLLWGCFQVDTVVRVKKDGSGTVEERMVMGGMFVAQMKMMSAQMGAMGGEAAGAGEFSLLDEEKLRARAGSGACCLGHLVAPRQAGPHPLSGQAPWLSEPGCLGVSTFATPTSRSTEAPAEGLS